MNGILYSWLIESKLIAVVLITYKYNIGTEYLQGCLYCDYGYSIAYIYLGWGVMAKRQNLLSARKNTEFWRDMITNNLEGQGT